MSIKQLAQNARNASLKMAALSEETKNKALARIAQALKDNTNAITQANLEDIARSKEQQISDVLIKRLNFNENKINSSIVGIESLIKLTDPVGKTLSCTELDNDLELYKVTAPIGVLGIVFESRPDALVQISTLALKSGNALLLKGGSEAAKTNQILAKLIYDASIEAGLPEGWLALLETRDDVSAMLAQDKYIDLIIPRGSNAFVKYIMDNTRIMVLGHADGICHVFIDSAADVTKAVNIAFDSKCQYPAVCNAVETLLVDESIARDVLPRLKAKYENAGVELRGCDRTCEIIGCTKATDDDWTTEYNDLILSIKIVDWIDQAIEHINTCGSHHTDAIVTEDPEKAKAFMNLVDSADVFWNCSTRFADGFRYGLGAEVGISTNKIHARGPVGLEGLLTYKWKMIGTGQTVAEYADQTAKPFTHRSLDKDCPI